MRPQELYHLRWDDLDFGANTITVQSKEDWATKTGDFRVIDMTPRLRETLLTLQSLSEGDYVFTYKGRRIAYGVRKAFGRIVRKAGIENCTLYTLRHTFASHLAMSGVPLMHIQQLMGHTDYNTTLLYAHLSTESQRGFVKNLPFANGEEEES
jgi:integrase